MKLEAYYKDELQGHLRLQEAKEKYNFDYFKLLNYKTDLLLREKFTGEKTFELRDPEGKAAIVTVTMIFEERPENFEEQRRAMIKEFSLSDFKKIIKRWLYIEDDEVLDIVLAGIISEKIDGDPLWLFLIAPSGGSKTELLRSFNGDYAFHLSDMTSKTLISGLMVGEGKKRTKVKDLLPMLDGKVLIFKDFTTILEKGREERNEIIAQFREAYDGSFAKKVGTVDYTIRYNSRFGLVAGVTPVIDRHWKVMQQLGERFLKVRWREDGDKVTKRARENGGSEKIMRKELIENSNKFISNLNLKDIPQFDDEKFGDFVSLIAKFIAYGRTPISIQEGSSDFYHDYIPTPEMPTRLVKQLLKLAKCLAVIRNKPDVTQEEIKTLIRVARDTIPPDREAILEAIHTFENETLYGCPRARLCRILKLPETSIRRIIEQLRILDLVEEKTVSDSDRFSQPMLYYKLSGLCGNIFGRVPEKLEDTARDIVNSKQSNNITNNTK